jgi:hypothetical protein
MAFAGHEDMPLSEVGSRGREEGFPAMIAVNRGVCGGQEGASRLTRVKLGRWGRDWLYNITARVEARLSEVTRG